MTRTRNIIFLVLEVQVGLGRAADDRPLRGEGMRVGLAAGAAQPDPRVHWRRG